MKKLFSIAAVGLVCLLTAVLILMPNMIGRKERKEILCTDREGVVRRLTYAEAYERLGTVDRDGIYLTDGGFIAGSETLQTVVDTLEGGDSVLILAIDSEKLTDLERVAVYREWKDTLFYDGVPFVWDGHRAVRTEDVRARKAVLSYGDFPKGFLAETGATELYVCGSSSPTADGLVGSYITTLRAEAPYVAENGCLYLEHRGRRLIAALPNTQLEIGETDFYDEGALNACTQLTDLTLPFVQGEFRTLFSEGVPKSLKRVCVLSGTLSDLAFYACPDIEEIVACGVTAQEGAFIGCSSLKKLHIATETVALVGEYSVTRAECGCFIFTKTG